MYNEVNDSSASATLKGWVESYSDSMYSWALHKLSNKETAEDLVQETFMAAMVSMDKYKGDSNPKTWLFAILNNKINDHYRHAFRNPQVDGLPDVEKWFDANDQWKSEERPLDWAADTGHLLDDSDFQSVLHACMKRLPDHWFSAIQLKFIEEKNGNAICLELGITNANFWQILHRAKLQLRKCLEVNWFKK
ncbi:MAG: sigma-70 family RNA polymerase sigma factor [Saprospiraceae bacterium]|nr:sigma-70 family RNA polymerase sigma factor [Saprospiraceae bacterium]